MYIYIHGGLAYPNMYISECTCGREAVCQLAAVATCLCGSRPGEVEVYVI